MKKLLIVAGIFLLIGLIAGGSAEATNPAEENIVVINRPTPTGEHTVYSTAPDYGLAIAWSQFYEYISKVSWSVHDGKISE